MKRIGLRLWMLMGVVTAAACGAPNASRTPDDPVMVMRAQRNAGTAIAGDKSARTESMASNEGRFDSAP
jgi:hypothetical protein